MESVLYILPLAICGITFLIISFSAFKSKKPIGFWSGKEVDYNKVSDVSAYNKANGIMWLCYASIYFFAIVILLLGYPEFSVYLVIAANTLGLIVLILVYKAICNKYFKDNI